MGRVYNSGDLAGTLPSNLWISGLTLRLHSYHRYLPLQPTTHTKPSFSLSQTHSFKMVRPLTHTHSSSAQFTINHISSSLQFELTNPISHFNFININVNRPEKLLSPTRNPVKSNLVPPVPVSNSPLVVFTDTSRPNPTTTSESLVKPPSTPLLSSSTSPLKYLNWPVTPQEILRSSVSLLVTCNLPSVVTMNWTL